MTEPEKRICRYFNTLGGCWYADNCKFMHIPNKKPPCKFHASSTGCRFGESCHFSHDGMPFKSGDNYNGALVDSYKENYKENLSPIELSGTNNNSSMTLLSTAGSLPVRIASHVTDSEPCVKHNEYNNSSESSSPDEHQINPRDVCLNRRSRSLTTQQQSLTTVSDARSLPKPRCFSTDLARQLTKNGNANNTISITTDSVSTLIRADRKQSKSPQPSEMRPSRILIPGYGNRSAGLNSRRAAGGDKMTDGDPDRTSAKQTAYHQHTASESSSAGYDASSRQFLAQLQSSNNNNNNNNNTAMLAYQNALIQANQQLLNQHTRNDAQAGNMNSSCEAEVVCGSCRRALERQGNESYCTLLKDHYLECFLEKEGDHVKCVKSKAALESGQMYWCKSCILIFEKPWSLFQHMADKAKGGKVQRWEKKIHLDWMDNVAGLMAGYDLGLFSPAKLRTDLRNLLADQHTVEEDMEAAALQAAAMMQWFNPLGGGGGGGGSSPWRLQQRDMMRKIEQVNRQMFRKTSASNSALAFLASASQAMLPAGGRCSALPAAVSSNSLVNGQFEHLNRTRSWLNSVAQRHDWVSEAACRKASSTHHGIGSNEVYQEEAADTSRYQAVVCDGNSNASTCKDVSNSDKDSVVDVDVNEESSKDDTLVGSHGDCSKTTPVNADGSNKPRSDSVTRSSGDSCERKRQDSSSLSKNHLPSSEVNGIVDSNNTNVHGDGRFNTSNNNKHSEDRHPYDYKRSNSSNSNNHIGGGSYGYAPPLASGVGSKGGSYHPHYYNSASSSHRYKNNNPNYPDPYYRFQRSSYRGYRPPSSNYAGGFVQRPPRVAHRSGGHRMPFNPRLAGPNCQGNGSNASFNPPSFHAGLDLNCGFTNDEVDELMSQGIKPWDSEASAALAVLHGEMDHLLDRN